MPARRRPRSEMTRSPQQRAIAIAIKNRAKYPYATYGRAYMQRGTEDNLAMFGPSYREATAEQKAKRRALGYTGRGAYWGKKIGSWLGRRTGVPGAGTLAGYAGSKLEDLARKRFAGRGLYVGSGSYNNLIEGGDMSMAASGTGDETESVVFTNREYIKDIYGPADSKFHNQRITINPGLENAFPWLSQVAMNYEEYQLEQLVFEFHSTVNASTGGDGQTGTIVMATNYNPSEPGFTDKAAMMQYHGGQSGRVTSDLAHGVECAPKKSVGDMHKYVRSEPVSDDVKDYDHGNFNLALVNIPTEFQNEQIGELWVYYRVRLLKPKLGVARMLNESLDRFVYNAVAPTTFTFVTLDSNTEWNDGIGATKLSCSENNNIGCLWDGKSLTFPATTTGSFEIRLRALCKVECSQPLNGFPMEDFIVQVGFTGNLSFPDLMLLPSPNGRRQSDADPNNLATVSFDRQHLVVEPQEFYGATGPGQTLFVSYTLLIDVDAATGGVDNTISLQPKNRVDAINPGILTTYFGINHAVEVREIKKNVNTKLVAC